MKNIAIITAREGSKRIPGKNIKNFCGKPIIAYSIEAAIASGVFDEIMVSTDSQEIAEIALSYGAGVPFFRSKDNSDDFATTADVVSEVLEQYGERGEVFDIVCCIYPTAPFIKSERLINAMETLLAAEAESAMTVVKFGFPPQRAFVVENGVLQYKNPVYAQARSQDLEPQYHDCGQFYLSKTSAFLKNKSFITEKTIPIFVTEEESQDIDTVSDWKLAEIKYERLYGQKRQGEVTED